MLDELDFRKEADNIDEFRTFLRDADITEATAPRVYRHLSTPKVLTMVSIGTVACTLYEVVATVQRRSETIVHMEQCGSQCLMHQYCEP
jgi:aarF domain-containing kinase